MQTSAAAYLTITRFTGDGDQLLDEYERYAEVMSGVGRTHGLLLHAGARTEDGFMVLNLWPSRDCSEAAARDPRRLAVLEQVGLQPSRIQREHHDVARLEGHLLRTARFPCPIEDGGHPVR